MLSVFLSASVSQSVCVSVCLSASTPCQYVCLPLHRVSMSVCLYTVSVCLSASTPCQYVCLPLHRVSMSVCLYTVSVCLSASTPCQYVCLPLHRVSMSVCPQLQSYVEEQVLDHHKELTRAAEALRDSVAHEIHTFSGLSLDRILKPPSSEYVHVA